MRTTARTIIALLSVLFAIPSWAQPRCTVEKQVLNMGNIMYRVPRTAAFEVKNTGNKPLLITSAQPSCGCTQVEYTKAAIAPGKVGVVKTVYDAAMMGSFHKEVELLTNASTEPLYLVLEGRVTDQPSTDLSSFPIDLDNVRLDRNTIEFDNVNKGDRPVAELQIANAGTMAYQPQIMHLPPFLTATYEPAILPAGRTGRVKLTLDSDKLTDMGLTQRSIYLARYPGDKVAPDNEIAVSAVLLPDFDSQQYASPDAAPHLTLSSTEIDLGSFGRKKTLSTVVTLTNMGASPLVISRLQAFNKALGISCDSRINPGRTVKMKVTVHREWLARDKNPLRVLLICNDPMCPKVILTIKAS